MEYIMPYIPKSTSPYLLRPGLSSSLGSDIYTLNKFLKLTKPSELKPFNPISLLKDVKPSVTPPVKFTPQIPDWASAHNPNVIKSLPITQSIKLQPQTVKKEVLNLGNPKPIDFGLSSKGLGNNQNVTKTITTSPTTTPYNIKSYLGDITGLNRFSIKDFIEHPIKSTVQLPPTLLWNMSRNYWWRPFVKDKTSLGARALQVLGKVSTIPTTLSAGSAGVGLYNVIREGLPNGYIKNISNKDLQDNNVPEVLSEGISDQLSNRFNNEIVPAIIPIPGKLDMYDDTFIGDSLRRYIYRKSKAETQNAAHDIINYGPNIKPLTNKIESNTDIKLPNDTDQNVIKHMSNISRLFTPLGVTMDLTMRGISKPKSPDFDRKAVKQLYSDLVLDKDKNEDLDKKTQDIQRSTLYRTFMDAARQEKTKAINNGQQQLNNIGDNVLLTTPEQIFKKYNDVRKKYLK